MRFTFLSLFPRLLRGYFEDSILKRALDSGLISLDFVDFRGFSKDRLKKVDSPQIGGGAGQVIACEALENAIFSLRLENAHIIYLTPAAKRFTQKDAARLAAAHSHIVLVCGRYEGIDERFVEAFVDEVFSIGDFVLTGGELPALMLCDCVARQVGGVLGNADSLKGESFEGGLLEAPVFAKNDPKNAQNLSFVSEYSKGNHAKIRAFKNGLAACKTRYFRPDLYQNHQK